MTRPDPREVLGDDERRDLAAWEAATRPRSRRDDNPHPGLRTDEHGVDRNGNYYPEHDGRW